MKEERMTQPTVFISYSHKDEAEKEQLLTHLGATGLTSLWSDDRIGAGADWEAEISQAIAQARVAILLISANSLTSDYIQSKEVPTLLQRQEYERLIVFPVIAKPCPWKQVKWLARMNVRPKNGTPVWSHDGSHADEDLSAIAEEVAAIIKGTPNATSVSKGADVPLPPVTKSAGEVIVVLTGDLSSLSTDRQSAFIDAFAALVRASPRLIEVKGVYEGSIAFDLSIPSDASERLHSLLQSNSGQLRLLGVEKVILQRESGEEVWVVEEGKFVLVSTDLGGRERISPRILPGCFGWQPFHLPDTFDVNASQVGAVGSYPTAHFYGLTPEQVNELVSAVFRQLLESLPVIITALRTNDPERGVDGAVHIGGDVLNPAQVEALRRLATDPSADMPVATRRQVAAAAQMVSDDVAPAADFTARAREYARRQHADQHAPLTCAEAEEATYVPLPLRFSRSIRPSLDDLYRQEERPFPDILAAVDAPDPHSNPPRPFPALVLLGDPGGGKSTSLRHLALILLRAVLADPAASLPLFVNLGDYKGDSPGDFLAEQWAHWYGDGDLPAVMQDGRLWLLADGLNEMLAADEREYEARVQAWRLFLRDTFTPDKNNRALVACRTADYGTGLELPRLQVEPMDDRRMAAFIAARFRNAPEQGGHLLTALQADRQAYGAEHGLYGLACNPFWLVMLTDVYRQLDCLPRNRADLVQAFVDNWLRHEADRQRRLDQTFGERERAALQLALDALAFATLARGQNTPQPRRWALDQLPAQVDVSGDMVSMPPATALKLAEAACLLECRGRAEARHVRFYHQLLLEHFAGRELLARFRGGKLDADNLQPSIWRIPWTEKWQFVESAWDPLAPPPTTGWEEATVLAAARAVLLDLEIGGAGDWPRLSVAVLAHNPPLAARCLLEAGAALPKEAKATVTDRLLTVIRDPAATAGLDARQRLSLRIACGHALGHMGDPRIIAGERTTPDGVRFILPVWSQVVKAGPFLMGSRRDDPDAYADEYAPATDFKPHRVDIPYDYVVGRYPVTNAEYACFIQAGGYQNEAYWQTENARAWLRGELDLSEPWVKRWQQIAGWVRDGQLDPDQLLLQRRISPEQAESWKWAAGASDEELTAAVRQAYGAAGEQLTQPRFWDDRRYNNPSQPVVGVCWFEAAAYCAWLTTQMRESASERIGESLTRPFADSPIRLPSEAEWEKAARWDGATAHRYPWGDTWDEAWANTLEDRVLTTSPVGVYPEGASPCGALDMAGDVWEWTRSRWGPEVEQPAFAYPYRPTDGREDEESTDLRAVRGGSWFSEARLARAAFRDWDYPDFRYLSLGFRLVLRLS